MFGMPQSSFTKQKQRSPILTFSTIPREDKVHIETSFKKQFQFLKIPQTRQKHSICFKNLISSIRVRNPQVKGLTLWRFGISLCHPLVTRQQKKHFFLTKSVPMSCLNLPAFSIIAVANKPRLIFFSNSEIIVHYLAWKAWITRW